MIKYNYKKWKQRFRYNDRLLLADLQWKTFENYVSWRKFGFYKPPLEARRLFMLPLPKGESFLLNECDFVLSNASIEEKAVYLNLASMRSLWDYEHYGVKTYPVDAVLQKETLRLVNESTILEIKNGTIYFKFEEQ